jgi:hypothetical protein
VVVVVWPVAVVDALVALSAGGFSKQEAHRNAANNAAARPPVTLSVWRSLQPGGKRGVPEHFGVRLAHGASSNGQQPIHLGFSEGPAGGDEETTAEGVRLFVAPELSEPFDGFLLDAVESEEGVSLVLREPA